MTKERVWIFTIIIAFTIGVIVLWRCHEGKGMKHSLEQNATETVTEEKSEEVITEESKKAFEEAKYLTVEKVERTIIEEEEGMFETCYDTYLISDIDLTKETDQTQNYAKSIANEELDESQIEDLDFVEAFGTDYKQKSGWEIYEALLKECGIDGEINQVTFDQDTYALTQQKLYVMDNSCSVWNKDYMNAKYDELLEQKVCYQTAETENGVTIPDCFTATMRYKTGTQTITKSIYVQVSINNWITNEEG